MARLERLFVTSIYRAPLLASGLDVVVRALGQSCRSIAADDAAGQAWCRRHNYAGYTSYASLNDLTWRDPLFAELEQHLEKHVARFARAADFDLSGKSLALDSLWINILEPGGHHSGHIHPSSVVSGTFYVALPKGSAGLKFEDPRLAQMMAAPPRKAEAAIANRTFVEVTPEAGDVLLWESYLRHEVPTTRGRTERISISFNYRLAEAGS